MDVQQFIDLLRYVAELGMAAGAWRLANAVRTRQDATDKRVDNHEVRITAVEAKVG